MDGIQVSTNRFAGMADGLQRFPNAPAAGEPIEPAQIGGQASTTSTPGCDQSTHSVQMELGPDFINAMRDDRKRLEESNRRLTSTITQMRKEHEKGLAEFQEANKISEMRIAKEYQKLFDAVNAERMPPEIKRMIDELGSDPIRDIEKMESILKAWVKRTDDPQARYLYLQVKVNRAAGAIELTTKIVEHGTSGIKTVLQTQT